LVHSPIKFLPAVEVEAAEVMKYYCG
jgi:hypothetical protein